MISARQPTAVRDMLRCFRKKHFLPLSPSVAVAKCSAFWPNMASARPAFRAAYYDQIRKVIREECANALELRCTLRDGGKAIPTSVIVDREFFDTDEDGHVLEEQFVKFMDCDIQINKQVELYIDEGEEEVGRTAKLGLEAARERYKTRDERPPLGSPEALREAIVAIPNRVRNSMVAGVLVDLDFDWTMLVGDIPGMAARFEVAARILKQLGMTDAAIRSLSLHQKVILGEPHDMEEFDEIAIGEAFGQAAHQAIKMAQNPAVMASATGPELARIATACMQQYLVLQGRPTEIHEHSLATVEEDITAVLAEMRKRGMDIEGAMRDVTPVSDDPLLIEG